jgi:hypothetical protein
MIANRSNAIQVVSLLTEKEIKTLTRILLKLFMPDDSPENQRKKPSVRAADAQKEIDRADLHLTRQAQYPEAFKEILNGLSAAREKASDRRASFIEKRIPPTFINK